MADDLRVGVLVVGEQIELRLEALHGVAQDDFAMLCVADAVVVARRAKRQREAARAEAAL